MATTDYYDQPQELIKGDSDEWLLTVTEPNDVDPTQRDPVRLDQAVDGTADRYAILRAAGKRKGSDDTNAEALFFKDSQRGASDIAINGDQVTNPGNAEILIDTVDTSETEEPTIDRGDDAIHDYDVEVNRQDVERAGASNVGTISVTNGSNTVTGAGSTFTNAKPGDIIQITDAGDNLTRPALILSITDDTTLVVDRTIWTDEAGAAYEIRRNRRRTGAYGDLFFYRERVSKS